jgi:hypothetical protein
MNVGDLRTATALVATSTRIIVRVGDQYYLGTRCWPDTNGAPLGAALYIEVEKEPIAWRDAKKRLHRV